MLAFGRPTISKKAWPGSRDPFQIFAPLNFSGMTEDTIVKFCPRVGARNISFVITNYPQVGVVKVT